MQIENITMSIVKTPDTLGGKPRLEGRRISVLHIAEMVIDDRKSEISEHARTEGSRNAGRQPEIVANELDIGLDEVQEALAYYYRNIEEMNELRKKQKELEEKIKKKSPKPEKPES
ncbi:MAG: DUF433 domain-containing protein [Halobacteria archaeon]